MALHLKQVVEFGADDEGAAKVKLESTLTYHTL